MKVQQLNKLLSKRNSDRYSEPHRSNGLLDLKLDFTWYDYELMYNISQHQHHGSYGRPGVKIKSETNKENNSIVYKGK